MKTKALFASAILMCAAGILSAQTNKIYPFDDFFDDTVKVIKHVSLEDSLFYASLSDTIYPSRNNYPGDEMHNPIQAGTYSASFHYSDMQDTYAPFTHQYGRNTNDVFYRLVLTVRMNVTFTHEGSLLDDTYMYLLDSSGNLIASNDDYSGEAHCSNIRQSFIRRSLAAGTYYIVSEGCYGEGIITTNMTGFAAEYGYTTVPSSYSTEPGAVGGLGGVFGVSPMGGATYSIPIEVPVGVNGLQPELSIVYNSQSGNGMCGYGTSLAGLSAITRGPKDIYHDGSAKGISYQPDDALYLDGVRLILTSGTPGQSGATYSPESDPFTVVTAYGTCTTTSDNTWFEVKGSDGMAFKYGYSDSTRLSYTVSGGVQKIHSWYLGYAQQPTGNYMEYKYEKSGLCIYPKRILYSAHKDIPTYIMPHVNVIRFTYESRNDTVPIRFDGQLGRMNKRLKTISVETNDTIYRTYTLTYNVSGDGTGYKYSRLESVTEKNRYNESLPPVILNWSYLPAPNHSSANMSVSSPNMDPHFVSFTMPDQVFISGDLNNDGISDIIGMQAVERIDNGQRENRTYVYVYESLRSANGTVSYPVGYLYDLDPSVIIDEDNFTGCGNPNIIDFDGDGLMEIMIPYFQNLMGQNRVGFFMLMQNRLFVPVAYDLNGYQDVMPSFTTGDLDNDGKCEIVYAESVDGNAGNVRYHIIKHDPDTYSGYGHTKVSFVSPNGEYPKRLLVDDMNGDGLGDIVASSIHGYTIYWNQGGPSLSGSFAEQYNSSHTDMYDMRELFYTGDFNGDGLTDFLTNSYQYWYFFLNNGNGTFHKLNAGSINGIQNQWFTNNDNDKFHCDILDFDCDGKSDMIVTKASYNNSEDFVRTSTYWMRSTGTALQQVYHATSLREDDAYPYKFITGDFDGDGRVELANYGFDCVHGEDMDLDPIWRIYSNSGLTVQSGKVTSVTGDFGATTDITYSTLVDQTVYSKGTSDAYPAPKYIIPLNVVSQTVQDNGAAGMSTTNYSYSGLKIHLKGKGVLGFCSTTVSNVTLETSVITSVARWDNVFYIPTSTRVRTTVGNDSTVTVTTLSVVNKGLMKYFAYPSQTVETDFDGNAVTTALTYDTIHGYPLTETVSHAAGMYRSVSYSDYILAGGAYHPRTVRTGSMHSDDNVEFTQITAYEYNNAGLVTRKTENRQSADSVVTYYTVDMWGNVNDEERCPAGLPSMITYYGYDNSFRFISTVRTDPWTSLVSYTYDKWGNMIECQKAINPSSIVTVSYTYDGWDNRTSTTQTGAGEVTYTRGWNNSASKRFYILEQGTSRPWVKTWYDNRGREVGTESVGPKDISVTGTSTFNSKGLMISRTETQGELSVTHNYQYDSRGRVTGESVPGGPSVTYRYGNRIVTETYNNELVTQKVYDAWGNLKTLTDPVSSITNTYSSNGGIKTTVSEGATWTFGYDNRGNRTSMTDPDAGTTTYTYDALGREKRRVDGRGVVIVTDYDYLGHVIQERATGYGLRDTITHTYGTSGTGQTRLVSERHKNWTKSYDYDGYGRVTQETMSNGTVTMSRTYQYGSDGLLTQRTVPGNKNYYYTYDPYGNLTGVNGVNGAVDWSLETYTGRQTVSRIVLDGITADPFFKTHSYDQYGYVSRISTMQNNYYYQDARYSFSPQTGNLSSTLLHWMDYPQTYTYDSADRLTGVWDYNQNVMSMTYAANGNITSKTGVGDYTYNNTSKPHAVRSVDDMDDVDDFYEQFVDYNLWGKVCEVWRYDNNHYYYYTIEYGPDMQRVKSTLEDFDIPVYEKYYWDDYEQKTTLNDGVTNRQWYVEGIDGLAGMYADKIGPSTNRTCSTVIMTDYLGSIRAHSGAGPYQHERPYV